MHNDNSLVNSFADDKIAYLKQYRFNICPENSNAAGYTTEKLFESINCGCIPIYHGSFGAPEPEVVNPKAVLIWNDKNNNSSLISQVKELEENRKLYMEFASQPRLADTAEEWICDKYECLARIISIL